MRRTPVFIVVVLLALCSWPGNPAAQRGPTMSAELRVPLNSPLTIAKIGVSAFVDTGTVYGDGQRFADQPLKTGVGGSVWLSVAFVRLNVVVAHGIGSSTRMHFGGGVSF